MPDSCATYEHIMRTTFSIK